MVITSIELYTSMPVSVTFTRCEDPRAGFEWLNWKFFSASSCAIEFKPCVNVCIQVATSHVDKCKRIKNIIFIACICMVKFIFVKETFSERDKRKRGGDGWCQLRGISTQRACLFWHGSVVALYKVYIIIDDILGIKCTHITWWLSICVNTFWHFSFSVLWMQSRWLS